MATMSSKTMTTPSNSPGFWRGDAYRISRFHNEKGHFALASLEDIGDCAISAATTFARVTFGYRPETPWIVLKAFRFLRRTLPPNAKVFEWSSGMSTLWFEKHCAEVHSVEDYEPWYQLVSKRIQKADLQYLTGRDYVDAIRKFPTGYFDLISIDGSDRLACYETALPYLKPGGILLIDNTDKDQQSKGEMWELNRQLETLPGFDVHRFPGWVHGSWTPIETTVCVDRRNA